MVESEFVQSMSLSKQPNQNLFTLYQGWMDCLTAFAASRITGEFRPMESPEQAEIRLAALDEYEEMERELKSLRSQAKNEKQVDRLVDLNLEIKRLQSLKVELKKTFEG